MTTDEQFPTAQQQPDGCVNLTFGSIIRRTMNLVRQGGWTMARALLMPVGLIVVGLYSSLALSLWMEQWLAQPAMIAFTQENKVLAILAILLPCLLGLSLFLRGGWQYMVYWASLCRNVRELCENRPMDIKTAYEAIAIHRRPVYVRWLSLLCMLPLIPLGSLLGLPFLGSLMSPVTPMAGWLLMLAGIFLGGVLGLGWLVAQWLLSYGFQAIALEAVEPTLWPLCRQSARLTLQRPWLTIGLQAVLFLLSNYILTIPAAFLLRFTRILTPLDDLNGWLIHTIVGNFADVLSPGAMSGLMDQLLVQMQVNQVSLAQGATDSIISMVTSLLLLPLGTIAFTLVYMGLRGQKTSDL